MPLDVVALEPPLVRLRAAGVVTYGECLRVIEQLLSDTRVGPRTSMLCDSRAAASVPSIGEMASVAYRFGQLYSRGVRRLAFVLCADEIRLAAKVFASFAGVFGTDTRIFDDEAPALEWLRREAQG